MPDATHMHMDKKHIERIFVFSMAWALGGLLEEIDREKFDKHLRMSCLDMPPEDLRGHSMRLSIFAYMVTPDGMYPCTEFCG